MPQGRIVLKSICQSKKIAALKTDGARLLYTWLLVNVDINGCYSGDVDVIKGQILTRLKKTDKEVEGFLSDMESQGLIVIYEANGDVFLHIPDFARKQPSLNPDREAKSTIPLPTPDELRGNSCKNPLKVKESKVKESKVEDIKRVFGVWNLNKGMYVNGQKSKGTFKSHTKITVDIEKATRLRLKEYSLEDICGAINNYAKILLSKDYTWTHRWTLQQFLTRHSPQYRSELQILRFIPNNYQDDDFLTPSARKARIAKARPKPAKQTPKKPVETPLGRIKKLTLKQAREEYRDPKTDVFIRKLIRKTHPEVVKGK